jgi:formamidopyrimidine-DNA glycosylase
VPELPEVETVRRQLGPRLTGRRVLQADSHPSEKFTPARELVGATFDGHGRRGKFLLFDLDDDRQLVVHLGMTGRLELTPPPDPRPDGTIPDPWDQDTAHLRAWWTLDDHSTLRFVDIRRFGRLRVIPRGDFSSIPTLRTAGPEPWDPDLDGAEFARRLRSSRRRIKTQLLSQRPVAGVGNIYADEALWLAEVNPRATRLSVDRAGTLLDAIREVLERGIANGGTTLRDYRDGDGREGGNQHHLAAYGRRGQPCLRCGTELRGAVIDTRATTWCPACQRR